LRRGTLLAALLALAVIALAPVGRWERGRMAAGEVRGMTRVLAEIGPLDSPALSGYRHFAPFDCLTYRRGEEPFALEVCVDGAGRVVEAIDRRSGDPKVWSLRNDREESTLRVDRAEVDRLLRKMGVPAA
jgi:hypothetical protein